MLPRKLTPQPTFRRQLTEIRVKARPGAQRASLRITVDCLAPFGKVISISPVPVAWRVFPSAVLIGRLDDGTKLENLDLSGQKWRVAPLSTIAPSLDFGTLSKDASSVKSDVQENANASGFSVVVAFADSSFFASFPDPFFVDF
jgi:hypothetical protein